MKRVRIKEDSWIPAFLSVFVNIKAITIYPFIFVRGKIENQTLRTHEFIHIQQQRELYLVGFYFLYVWYWLKNVVWRRMSFMNAYRAIPFEVEAYENEHDELYPLTREKMAWKKCHSDGAIKVVVEIDLNDLKRDK